MYKIVTCNCKRYRLDQLNITYTYSLFFDNCLCSTEHDILAIKYKVFLYNLVGFARNYFASICCSCVNLNKDMVCFHCTNLVNASNSETIKILCENSRFAKGI